MSTIRFTAFGVLLAGAVGLAVASLAAQAPAPAPAPKPEPRQEIERPHRTLFIDSRGSHIGVVVRDVESGAGVRVEDVDRDGPAEKAGVRAGDIVVEFDGERVRSARQFTRLVRETADGRQVPLVVQRDGTRQTLTVTPDSRGADGRRFSGDDIVRDIAREFRQIEPRWRQIEPRLRGFRFDAPDLDAEVFAMPLLPPEARGRLGVQVEELTPQLGEYFGAKDGGVLVSSVTEGTPAAAAGLKAGDVITDVNGERVRGYRDLVKEIGDIDAGEISIGIVRDRKPQTLTATLPDTRDRGRVRTRRPA
ncbi:MAG: PDZ domain-containing protein [Acidobacteriota bacterium]